MRPPDASWTRPTVVENSIDLFAWLQDPGSNRTGKCCYDLVLLLVFHHVWPAIDVKIGPLVIRGKVLMLHQPLFFVLGIFHDPRLCLAGAALQAGGDFAPFAFVDVLLNG